MNIEFLLHTDRNEVRKVLFGKIEKSEIEVQNDIKILKNWFEYQKHLPEIPCDSILEIFLIVNKFNLEKCKKKLEMYYTIRRQIPELYLNKNPKLDHMKHIADTVYCIPLPILTPSLSRVTVMKLKNQDPENFNTLDYFAHTYNLIEIRVREDMLLSDTLIYDMEGFKFGHVLKMGPGTIKKSATVLEKVFSSRIEGIHYINLPSSMQILINLVKTMLKSKIRNRMHVHEDLESLYKHLPRDVLPLDYGGDVPSLAELQELWKKKFEKKQELFDDLEKLTLTMCERPSASNGTKNTGSLETSGVDDFRNLCLD